MVGPALGIDAERRLAGLRDLERRLRQFGAVVVGKMIAAHGGQRFARLAFRIEVGCAEIDEKEIGIMPC